MTIYSDATSSFTTTVRVNFATYSRRHFAIHRTFPRAIEEKKNGIRGKCTVASVRGLILVNGRLHAISRLRQMAFGLDRVLVEKSTVGTARDDERAKSTRRMGDTSGQFFFTLFEALFEKIDTQYPPRIRALVRFSFSFPTFYRRSR